VDAEKRRRGRGVAAGAAGRGKRAKESCGDRSPRSPSCAGFFFSWSKKKASFYTERKTIFSFLVLFLGARRPPRCQRRVPEEVCAPLSFGSHTGGALHKLVRGTRGLNSLPSFFFRDDHDSSHRTLPLSLLSPRLFSPRQAKQMKVPRESTRPNGRKRITARPRGRANPNLAQPYSAKPRASRRRVFLRLPLFLSASNFSSLLVLQQNSQHESEEKRPDEPGSGLEPTPGEPSPSR